MALGSDSLPLQLPWAEQGSGQVTEDEAERGGSLQNLEGPCFGFSWCDSCDLLTYLELMVSVLITYHCQTFDSNETESKYGLNPI